MKYPLTTAIAFILAIGSQSAVAAECEFRKNKVDETSNERVVVTEWEGLSHPIRPVAREMTADVAGSSRGDKKHLSMRIEYVRTSKTWPSRDVLQQSVYVPEGGELLINIDLSGDAAKFVLKEIAVPTPGGLALLGVAGLAARRRRRA